MKIRTRATLLGMLPALLVATLLGAYLGMSRLTEMQNDLRSRGASLVRHLAHDARHGLIHGEPEVIAELLARMAGEPDVVYLAILDRDGGVLAGHGLPPADVLTRPLRAGLAESRLQIAFTEPVVSPGQDRGSPDTARARPVGWARVVVSPAGHDREVRHMLLAIVAITSLGLTFAWLLVRHLALSGVRPLMQTIATVRELASGNLDARLPVTARSELRILQQDINELASALRALREDMLSQVAAATAELTAQKEAAEQADLAKSRFLAAASHDLRQPLHALGLLVEGLKSQLDGRQAAGTLARIEVAVDSLDSLFNAILDISRLDAGALVPRPVTLAVAPLLQRLGAEFQAEAGRRGLRVRVRCPADLAVDVDPVLLERILRNLLSNALRYTHAGGILLGGRRRGGQAVLQVWDTGIGIEPQEQRRVFEEFYQVGNPHRDRTRGLGLGLSIVQRLADLLDCPLRLDSRPGRGSVFSLTVPLSMSAAAGGGAPAPLPPAGMLTGRVLVVDDDDAGREALAALLAGWGLEVSTAAGSADALRGLQRPPEVLITDYRLAGENGLQVIDALAEAFPGQDFRALVISADIAEETRATIRARGLCLLTKPLRPAKLRALLTPSVR